MEELNNPVEEMFSEVGYWDILGWAMWDTIGDVGTIQRLQIVFNIQEEGETVKAGMLNYHCVRFLL